MDATVPTPKRARREPAPTTPDPIEIAMEAEAGDERPDSPARALLERHSRLADADLVHRRWQIAGERMGFALRAGMGLLGLAAVGVVAAMVWRAAHADGLVIRPFSVPPSLAQRGVTGEAVAAGLMDRLAVMGRVARSAETQREFVASQNEVSIQIPETGISISQLEQWLTEKFGHQRRITGELMTSPNGGLVLAARMAATPLEEQRGPQQDLGALLQRAAEEIYSAEQPISYATFLNRQDRLEDLRKFRLSQITSPERAQRARGFAGLAQPKLNSDLMDRQRLLEKAVGIDPKSALAAHNNLAGLAIIQGRLEVSRWHLMQDASLLKDPTAFATLSPLARAQWLRNDEALLARQTQDWGRALRLDQEAAEDDLRGFASGGNTSPLSVAGDFAALHDISRARATLADFEPQNDQEGTLIPGAALNIAVAAEDWAAAWAGWQAQAATWAGRTDKGAYEHLARSRGAKILVSQGRLAEAQALIGMTPLDCAPCVMVRGELAAARGEVARADHWLAEASRIAPSFPLLPYQWGQVLLARGSWTAAIGQFRMANQRGPNWADPLEGWGEALLGQGDAAAAAAKFEAADKLAPKWGRLHLKWGEALGRLGKVDEARAHWRTASQLDLTPAERAELTRVQGAK